MPALLATVACGCGSTVARIEAERSTFASSVEVLVRNKDIDGLLQLHYPKGMTQELREMVRNDYAWLDRAGDADTLRFNLAPLPGPLPSSLETAGRKLRFNALPIGMLRIEYEDDRDDGERWYGANTILYTVVNDRYYIVGLEYE